MSPLKPLDMDAFSLPALVLFLGGHLQHPHIELHGDRAQTDNKNNNWCLAVCSIV